MNDAIKTHNILTNRRFVILFLFTILYSYTQATTISKVSLKTDQLYVYVVQSAWHTGIILKTENIDSEIWPEVIQYQNFSLIDIGWGDEKFYQNTGSPFFLAARAILWPTPSIIELYAFNSLPAVINNEKARILKIPVTEDQLRALCVFISNSFLRNQLGEVQLSRLYETNTRFFLATQKYHLFKTCNTWIAIAFKKSGFQIRSNFVLNANQLFRQLKKIPDSEFIKSQSMPAPNQL